MARYGHERHGALDLYTPSSKKAYELYELLQRRRDLTQTLVAEKNRKQGPRSEIIQEGCAELIELLKKQRDEVNRGIDELIAGDESLSKKREVLLTIPCVGPIVSSELLAMMPELATMNRRQAASLAGLAPRANEC